MEKRTTEGLDIVIVNHNGRETLSKCLEGIFCSSSGRVKITIVDQGSSDGTREYLEKKRVSHLILNEYNNGKAEALNQGITVGRYPWVCLINLAVGIRDTEWIDKMWSYTYTKGVGIVEGAVRFEGKKQFMGLDFCLISRKCLKEVGLFDEQISSGVNSDMLSRIEWAGYSTAFCSEVKAEYLLPIKIKSHVNLGYKYKLMSEKFESNTRRRAEQNLSFKEESYNAFNE